MIFTLFALFTGQSQAQYGGANFKGDNGVLSGSQAPPGWYLSLFYGSYAGDSIRDRNGNAIRIDPAGRGSLDANGYSIGLLRVTEHKLFGGNYGFMIFPGWTDNKLQIPVLGLEERTDTGFTDLYFQPINLGWNTDRADFTAGIGVYAPTGRYEPDASDNLGMGMWSFELFGGTSVYMDKAKTWSFATTAFFEFHTEKEDSDIKVGDILTQEGGFGKSFVDGAANLGVAYYAQWKLSADDFGSGFEPPDGVVIGKHKVYGVGPELTFPIATKKKLIAFVNVRYLWESSARTTTEGSSLAVTATFPVPSLKY